LGVPFSSTGSTSFPLLYQLGFTFPLGKKVNILAESFIDTNFEGLLNIGIRIITKSNIVIDAGLSRPTGIGEIGIIGLPLLSLSIPF